MSGKIEETETINLGPIGLWLEPGILNENGEQAVVLQIVGSGCKTFARQKFVRGQTTEFDISISVPPSVVTNFHVTVSDLGVENGKTFAWFRVFPSGGEKYCRPVCSLSSDEIYAVILSEGESTTVNGWTIEVSEIVQNRNTAASSPSPPDCSIYYKEARFAVTTPGASFLPTWYFPEDVCLVNIIDNRCISIYVKKIDQFVLEQNGQCIVSNENITLTLKVSTP